MKKLNENQKNIFKVIIQELFYLFSILVAIFFIFDIVLKGLISAYLNLNLFLIIWFIIACLDLWFSEKKQNVKKYF